MHLSLHLLAAAVVAGLLVAPVRAQTTTFPNNTLETWVTRGGNEVPANWLTTEDLTGGGFSTNTVVKTNVAHGGSFAAQLQTQSIAGVAQFPGILILGTAINRTSTGLGGLPFTARPRSLQFYYQLTGQRAVGDSATMLVLLTRRASGTAAPVVVAGGSYDFISPASSYTLVTVPLQYLSALAPDSVAMLFVSGTSTTVTVGTVLRIDDITFSGTATATHDAALQAALAIAPNPSPDGRYQLSSTEPALLAAPLIVLDATGRVVRREEAPPMAIPRLLDLHDLPSGIYTVQLLTARGLVVRRLQR